MTVDDIDPLSPSACKLSQLDAVGNLSRLMLCTLSKLVAAVLSRARLSRALQDPIPRPF